MLLRGAVAVLTGAGRRNGVGAATARLLAQEGCNVLINCVKSEAQAKSVIEDCKTLGVEADLFMGDVTQQEVCHQMADHVQSRWGRTDVVVNCVGATKGAPYERLDKLDLEDFSKLFATNVTGPYLIAQAFQQSLRQSGDGVFINVSSAAGITGKGSSIAYAAAKGGENTLTLALAQALSPEVRVNAVCPSFIDSSWWEEVYEGKEEKYGALVRSMQESNLLRRVLKPSDVAHTIMSVIHNPVMTGELVRIDSGAHVGKANPREEEGNSPSLKR